LKINNKQKRIFTLLKENTQTRAIKGNIIYRAMRALVRVYSMLVFNMDIEKMENLPEGPKIFVANHPSLTDPFILQLETHMSVVITGKTFAIPLVGRFLKHIHQISAESGSGTLDKALEHLQNGRSIGIFPEGANSHEGGGMKDFRSGAARLALMSGVPVIPVGIHLRRDRFFRSISYMTGKKDIALFYLWGPYIMTLGKPMVFTGDVENRELVRTVTEEIFTQVRSLAMQSETRMGKKIKPVRSKVSQS